MNKYIVTIVVMCMLFACNGNDLNPTHPVYKINMDACENYNFTDLADSIYYIELETVDTVMIGEISKIIIDDYIFLLDRKSQSVNLYTKQGVLFSVISCIGNGPGEYIRIDDFFVDSKRKIVNVLDGTKSKIIKYSFGSQFIEEISIPLNKGLSRFIIYQGDYYFDQRFRRNGESDSYNLIVMDSLCNIVDKKFNYDSYLDIMLGLRKSLFVMNDTLSYIPLYSDVVYNISPQRTITPRYSFDFGRKWINLDYVFNESNDPMGFVRGLENSGGIYFFNMIESTSHIFVDYMFKNKNYYSIINKGNLEVKTGQNINVNSRKDNHAPLVTMEQYFVMPVERHNAPVEYQVENPDEYNPILMFLKFK